MSEQPLLEPLKQTPHIVAFLDFLGATEKMNNPAKNDKFLQEIYTVYNFANHILEKTKQEHHKTLKIKIFSDNIVIAQEINATNNPGDVKKAYIDVEQFALMLYTNALLNNNIIRGAISIGSLYMNNDFIFGEALLNAYSGESKIANYPRIIVEKEIFVKSGINMWNTFNPPDEENIILRDMDGELYLNPFWGIPKISEFDKRKVEKLLNLIGSFILEEYRGQFEKNRKFVFPKYHWLANQFNEYCHANNHPFLINLDKLTLEEKNE